MRMDWWLMVGIVCICARRTESDTSCVVELNADTSTLAVGRWKNLTDAVEVLAASSPFAGYCSYRGIPYAKPPIGELRFEPPQPEPPSWTGSRYFNRSASSHSDGADSDDPIRCPQYIWLDSRQQWGVFGNEDCLYLDVHVPKERLDKSGAEESDAGLPVVVWLHGGSFNLGHASSVVGEPDYLVMQGIIVVAINYRLCALGFLAISEANITGNFGLHDQRLALRWVHQHISALGGDPNRVTLMGWSAGSAAVGYHISAADDADAGPLFHRAIMMSGAPNNPWAVQRTSSDCSKTLLQQLNLTDVAAGELKVRLQNVSVSQLILRNMRENSLEFFGSLEYGFVPTVDGQLVGIEPHLMPPPNVRRRPLLIGYTRIETVSQFETGLGCRDVRWPTESFEKLPDILGQLARFMEQNVEAIAEEGSASRPGQLTFLENLRGIADIKYGVSRFAHTYHRIACKPIVYQFSFAGKLGGLRRHQTSQAVGPIHGDDLGYLSGDMSAIANADEASLAANAVRRELVTLWSNFIKTGISKADESEDCRPFADDDEIDLVDIDRNISRLPWRRCWESAEYRLWDAVYRCVYGANCADLESNYLSENQTLWDARDATDSRCKLHGSAEENTND